MSALSPQTIFSLVDGHASLQSPALDRLYTFSSGRAHSRLQPALAERFGAAIAHTAARPRGKALGMALIELSCRAGGGQQAASGLCHTQGHARPDLVQRCASLQAADVQAGRRTRLC